MPVISAFFTGFEYPAVPVEILGEGSEMETGSRPARVAKAAESPLLGAAAGGDQPAFRFLRAFRDDINDPVHGIGAPHGRAGPANHFDAVHIFQKRILYSPPYTRKERRIDAPPVDHHEQLIGIAAIETAGSNGP